MKVKSHHIILIIIFLLALSTRLFVAFQTPVLEYEGYFNVRQVESIAETGKPIINDPLSFGGRILVFTPLFQYITAVFNLFLPVHLTLKLIPNIFASLLVIVIYLLCYEITKNRSASLVASFLSGFVPIFVSETVNSASSFSLLVPLIFLALYFILKLEKDNKYAVFFVINFLILTLISPITFVIVLSLLFYLLFLKLGQMKQSSAESELILFSTFVLIWVYFILFKKILLMHGPQLFWQNIPSQILSEYFVRTNILEAIYKIGIFPFIGGIYIIYHNMFKDKKRSTSLLIGFAFSISLLLWFRLIALNTGLIFLGVTLVILFSQFYRLLFEYLKKTRYVFDGKILFILFILLAIMTSVLPSFSYSMKSLQNTPDVRDIEALMWLKSNSPDDSVIAATFDEGHLITAIAGRKNIADHNFLLIPDAKQRLEDVDTLFTGPYITNAVEILNYYEADYIFFSDNTKERFEIDDLSYGEGDCFKLIYDQNVKIYESVCRLE